MNWNCIAVLGWAGLGDFLVTVFVYFLKYVFGVHMSLGKPGWDWWNKSVQGWFKVFVVFMFKYL